MENGLRQAAAVAGVEHSTGRVGSMMTLFFHDGDVTCWEDAAQCDTKRFAKYFWGLSDRGVYMPCSQYEALFISAAHTTDDIDVTIAAATEVFAGW